MKTMLFAAAVVVALMFSGCSDDDYGVGEVVCTCKAPQYIEPPQEHEHYLLTCIYNGDLEVVKSVVKKHGWDKDDVPYAVNYAVKCGRAEILAWLLDNGWDANPETRESALVAAYKVNCQVVKVLLENDAELNDKHEETHWINDDYKRTALHYAISSGRPCMVKTTLECDVDADPGRSYYPPLLEAVYKINSDIAVTEQICRLLVKYGADAERKGVVHIWQKEKKINPAEYLLHYRKPGSGSLLSFLMSHGAEAKINPQDLENMFSLADIMDENNELLEDYPEVRVNILRKYLTWICEYPDVSPKTAVEIKKCDELFRMMKKSGIDFNHPLPGRRETPLLMAAQNRQYELCKLLIKYGASKDKKVDGVAPRQYLK